MKSSTRMVVACLAVLLAPAVLAQSAKAPKATGKGGAVRWVANAMLMGPPFPCADNDSQCDVPVNMTVGTVGGVSVCLATVPEKIMVTVRSGFPPAKTIAWNLTPPNSGSMEFSFQPKNGILVLDNPHGQVNSGSIGTSNAQFIVKDKRNRQADAIYLPIILQTDTATGIVTLCAASDPKIVNEDPPPLKRTIKP